MRAALYARYSTDNQSDASVEDQLRQCRAYAARMGAHVVREFSDHAVSGQGEGNRPGFLALMSLVRAGGCEMVIADHSNRLARAGSTGYAVWEDLKAMGVRYTTVQEGAVTATIQGVSSLVSTMKIEEASLSTRRGLEGVVLGGRSGGGRSYGYRVKRLYDAAGEPIRGHLEIDEAEAAIVRRIFAAYAAGESPIAMVTKLNTEGVPAPRGGLWAVTTILGNAKRGNGIIHNALYRGVRTWGRQTFVKDRQSGARRGRPADPGQTVTVEVPDLRIVDDALWDAVRAAYEAHARAARSDGGAVRARRPKRLFQGLIVCGACGAPMHMAGPREALRCSTRINKGACDNTRTPGYPGLEARVIASIRANLLRPEAIQLAIETVQEELRQARRDAGRTRAKLQAELAEVERRMSRLIDQLEQGTPWTAIAERHGALDRRRGELTQQLHDQTDAIPTVVAHPSGATLYRDLIERLDRALSNPADPDAQEGRATVRALISEIRVTPREAYGEYGLDLLGDLAPILALATKKTPSREGVSLGAEPYKSMARLGAGTDVTRGHTRKVQVRHAA